MKADLLHDLLHLLENCDAAEGAKHQFRELINGVAAKNGLTVADPMEERAQRVEYARHLIRDMNEGRPTTRDRLIARFGVSRAQAYVDIADAIKNCPVEG